MSKSLKKESSLPSLVTPTISTREGRGTYKVAGHLNDMILQGAKNNDNQLDIFSLLEHRTKDELTRKGIASESIKIGIELDTAEHRIVDSLAQILHNKSQTQDPKKDSYYSGDKGLERSYIGNESVFHPKVSCTLYELAQVYTGNNTPSGKEEQNVMSILERLASKNYLMRYTREEQTGSQRKRTTFETYDWLVKYCRIEQQTLELDNTPTEKQGIKKEVLITLSQVFRDQIATKFIVMPVDLESRLIEAYGAPKLPNGLRVLCKHLLGVLSAKHYTAEYGQEKLLWDLQPSYMEVGRRKRAQEQVDKTIDTLTRVGIIMSHELTTAKTTGTPKYVFTLDKDFYSR